MRRCEVPGLVVCACSLVCRCFDEAADPDLRLIDAVKAGDRARVRALLKQPGELTRTEADGTTASALGRSRGRSGDHPSAARGEGRGQRRDA